MKQTPFSDVVKFEPWIDRKQYCQADVRVLFVGESHYTSQEEAGNRELTAQVVSRARAGDLDRHSGKSFFTNIAALANGSFLSDEERQAWWPTVAFYNYIQVPVGEEPRGALALELFDKAHDAFHEVLSIVQPQLIVILGRRVWLHMSARDASLAAPLSPEISDPVDSKYFEAWQYATDSETGALTFHVKHPSAGFNFRKFHPLYRDAVHRVSKTSG